MKAPVFYDPSGRRKRWSIRTLFALILALFVAACVFAFTIVDVPTPNALDIGIEHPQPRPIPAQIAHVGRVLKRAIGGWLPGTTKAAEAVHQQVIGFYVPWDDASKASLVRHISQIDWLVPDLIFVTGPKHDYVVTKDRVLDAVLRMGSSRPKILPMIQNAQNGVWDSAGTAALLHDPKARKTFLDQLDATLTAKHADGMVFDFEEVPATSQGDYLRLIAEARHRFGPRNMLVTMTVPVGDDDWNLKAYAHFADRLFIMDYDEHENSSAPGPIASQAWFVQQMRNAVAKIGPAKTIIAIGNYAYDWPKSGAADNSSVEEAWLTAHDSDAQIRFDPASGNSTFDYTDDSGNPRTVWMLDAASGWNQLKAADAVGVSAVALWRLGYEDPGIWDALKAFQGSKFPPDLSTLRSVGDVDVEGNGEVLRITDTPTTGTRSIQADHRGLIRDEQYHALPTPYVVTKTGYKPGYVALTFDDGPDGYWTPRILDILKREGVNATFFVIGENAVGHPMLLNREIAEGHEIGNHSYTHPNMALLQKRGTNIELNATQRLIEAYTGRGTRLLRLPYFGDAEPTTDDELVPALRAQEDGYVNVGLHVDSEDWQEPGVPTILRNTFKGVAASNDKFSGNIVLMHDAGGDRQQTMEALPQVIETLKAHGYKFVTVSQLIGLSRDQVMPQISGQDLLAVRADVGMFLFIGGLLALLKWLFFVAITLGIVRALLMATLATLSAREDRKEPPPAIDPTRFVSVLIPAFNEATVIEGSIRRVLASEEVTVEVIVIDDGSTDGTSDIVRAAFADEPRVRLLTLENGGKAAALNRGLELSDAEVIVALDADTQFEKGTIAKLSRWFADERTGAVAGNAKVGNRVNLVTRWQSVEYVTAQNLERRALTRFDAITVVPGAVGAWRRAALDAVGGYPVDTLAEDQDLTIAIQRAGWDVAYDVEAVAWTEAPETFRALSKQRFRWAFGTLQCLWKHGAILRERKPAGLALVGIPQAWLFQIGFAVISPIIDLALVISIVGTIIRVRQHGWAQTHTDVIRMAIYWVAFTFIDLLCGWIAYRLEPRRQRFPAFLLLAQRFVYRQLMYSVVLRAVSAALSGPWVGWGKLQRTGRVEAAAE
ncbi:glycosyltransferase [Sphingomonas sp. CGMCC 1.13654]|uniref:Chitooligosaccharide deacetylase n=1 Tax=Sphingomonas chungangi TaxID=2683589 RepID=A0A838L6E4_9SPHN|nr:glycosyltransferase [Sphingomonas chungangi]MBA2934212.1 glycosyltransferase [Sphingomonas chungangi]MVW57253.1 glycosyltransferase [Sphingomonas chungangi]